MSVRLFANVGGEEPLPAAAPAAATATARLFCLLFPPDARRLEAPDDAPGWPPGLGPVPSRAAYRWLRVDTGVFAWLNTQAAAQAAARAGLPLLGPPPEVVRRVHDKAFALECCRAEGLEASSLRGLATAFSSDALLETGAALEAIRGRVQAWPDWTRGRFTLKPRIGGSGRGRVGGAGDDALEAVRGALPRLARQGGAILEPWLERELDLSVQLLVADDGTLTLLATLEQQLSSSGVYRGHRGRLDHRYRIASGQRVEAELLEPAAALARAAHRAGYRGPCGVDAFVFRGPRGSELRPVVELNARFTLGTVVAGLLRRARATLEAELPAAPGQVRAFEFALAPPAGGWPPSAADDRVVIRLGDDPAPLAPALVVRRMD